MVDRRKEPKGEYVLTDKLAKWVEIKEWTQRRLSEEIDVPESFLGQITRKQKSPTWGFLKKVERLTGLTVGDLVVLDETKDF